MGLLFPLSGPKFVLTSSALACVIGWFSIVQQLNHSADASNTNCPHQQQLQEWKSQSAKAASLTAPYNQDQQHHRHKRLRVLMGIFTYDSRLQLPYRRQFRKLFGVFPKYNDTRVCSLHDFEHAASDEIRYECQFIYTFVVGGLKKDNARTELVDDSADILMPAENVRFQRTQELRESNDVTYLNIRENMNDGKSQTWFKFATTMMEKWDLDYAGKMDTDSLPYLDKFFNWAYVYLPPPPYNSGILAGVPIDKIWWSRNKAQINQDVNEDFFKESYGKVLHLYAAGQCYIISRDLAQTVVLEAPKSHAYREGHEDHDISAMAFHSPKPISFHFLSLQQQFWRHPVKRFKKKVRYWRTLWHNENVRMKKVLALRQEHLRLHEQKLQKNDKSDDDDNVAIPDQLAAPVQMTLDDPEAGTGNEEEEENTEAETEEEDLEDLLADPGEQAASDM